MKIDRERALRMLQDVVDRETSEADRAAFFYYLKQDDDLRERYERAVRFKRFLKERLPREKMPDDVRQRILSLTKDIEKASSASRSVDKKGWPSLKGLASESEDNNRDNYRRIDRSDSVTSEVLNSKKKNRWSARAARHPEWFQWSFYFKPLRIVAAAAVLLAISLTTLELLNHLSVQNGVDKDVALYIGEDSGESSGQGTGNGASDVADLLSGSQRLEDVMVALFSDENGFQDDPVYSFESGVKSDRIDSLLRVEMNSSPDLPIIAERDIRQIFGHAFGPELLAPVLAYYHEASGEWVYVVAFDEASLEQSLEVHRTPEAVWFCDKTDDFFVQKIDNKEVVSWRQGDYWYTAISNHRGAELIALME